MGEFMTDGLAGAMAEAALRGCALTALAVAVLIFLRKRGAAAEATVLGAVVAGSLAMPLIMTLSPPIFIRTAAPAAAAPVGQTLFALESAPPAALSLEPAATSVDWLSIAYCVGLVIGVLRLAFGFAAGAALRRRSKPARLPTPFEIRESDTVSVPMTFGWPRAFVVLPSSWPYWDEKKLQAVLLHEGAHIARGDFLLNALATLNAAVFWFSPHAWWLKRRLTEVSEQASDDRAMSTFGDRALYADILLSFAGRKTMPVAALPMARGAVSARIERALDEQRSLTGALGLKAGLIVGAVMSAAFYFTAGVSLAEAPASPVRTADLRPARPPGAPKPAPAPAAAPAPVAAPAPAEEPSAPDVLIPNDWDDVDSALAGADAESEHLAGRYRTHAQDEYTNEYKTWTSYNSDEPHAPFSLINVLDDRIEFVKNRKHFLIKDPDACDRAREYLEPVNELHAEQTEIGEEQSRLGEMMSAFDGRQRDASVETGALKAALQARMAEITKILAKSRLTQEELGDIQGRLGDLQGELGELQGQAAERQSEFSEHQSDIASEMAELSARQADLGQRQAEASRTAEAKIRNLIEKAIIDGRAKQVG